MRIYWTIDHCRSSIRSGLCAPSRQVNRQSIQQSIRNPQSSIRNEKSGRVSGLRTAAPANRHATRRPGFKKPPSTPRDQFRRSLRADPTSFAQKASESGRNRRIDSAVPGVHPGVAPTAPRLASGTPYQAHARLRRKRAHRARISRDRLERASAFAAVFARRVVAPTRAARVSDVD